MSGGDGLYQRGAVWWMNYVTVDGRRCRKSTGTKDHEKAAALRTKLVGPIVLSRLMKRLRDRIREVDGCWLWVGSENRSGYGHVRAGQAHRFVYELLNGPIPEACVLHHRCGHRTCVNPEHLVAMVPDAHRVLHRRAMVTVESH